ncbi:ectoine/hydroxyectoine ABC transporter permease subunit EhuC [Mesorhizobium sp. M0663]|uniref:ectoine/hydroxyectoine ABC transporter permease subunit EhuC n=1 Tax=Mesorhizobium sp. M0663 TaxID=2956981 RepID=UPI00333B15B5
MWFIDQGFGYFLLILQGARVTVEITIAGSLVALPAALLAGLGRLSRAKPIRWISTAYIEFFRGTSVIVQLFWIYFALPLFDVRLSPFQAGSLAIGLNVGAYAAEVVRAAVRAVPKDQLEAAVALNLTRSQSLRHIVLPQAFVIMLPALGNAGIELLKATSIVSLISLADMTFNAQIVRMQTGQTAGPYISILIMYFILASVIAWGTRSLERRVNFGLDRSWKP